MRLGRKRTGEDFAEEIEAHLELETDRLIAEGLSEDEARAAARRAFGNVTAARERFFESGRLVWLDQLWQDVRYAARMMRMSPGFTAAAVVTLALGIGANTAVFSVVDALLLRGLPYPDSDRLMTLWSRPPGGGHFGVAPANFLDLREQTRAFVHMAAVSPANFHVSLPDGAERLTGFRVTAEFFDALGVKPFLGRGFTAADDRPGAPKTAILSHAAWLAKFGGDPAILGQALTVDGEKCTVVGVLPQRFRFALSPEMFAPLAIDPAGASREMAVFPVFAKLKPGVPAAEGRAEAEGVFGNLVRAYPQPLKGWGIDVAPYRDELANYHRDSALALFGAVACVLLIACVNIANLMLAKAAVRQRELAVRAALGAGRARLMRQMLAESAPVAVLGGALGLLLARWLAPAVAATLSEFVRTGIGEIGIDWRVFIFTAAVSAAAGLLFGLLPAWRASRTDLQDVLRNTKNAGGGASGRRFRSALVAAELALSLVLLVGAGLMVRTLAAYASVDPGFNPDNVLTLRLAMPEARYAESERVRAFDRALLERVRAVPGVKSAGIGMFMPLEGSAYGMRFRLAGEQMQRSPFLFVSEGYFETLGIRLRRGRLFTARDAENAPRAAIVNQTFVKRFLPGREPVGEALFMEQWRGGRQPPGPPSGWEIVGVVADVKIGGLGSEPMPLIYAPVMQQTQAGGGLAVRTEGDPAAMAPAIRTAVRSVDKEVAMADVRSMRRAERESLSAPRSRALIVIAFAAVALLLAAVGTYGVMSYTVAQSAREMGVRMALGAPPRSLVRGVLAKGLMLGVMGLALGACGSLALQQVVRKLIFGVEPTDPATYIVVSGLLLAVAALAAYLPARRAARVDPAAALRWE